MTEFQDDWQTPGNTALAPNHLLTALLKSSGDCIKILDREGNLQFMSEAGRRVMEVEDFSALRGCSWPNLWAEPQSVDAREAVQAARAGQTARFRGPAHTAKGTPKYWDVTVSPIFGDDGEVTHILSVSRDVTAESRIEIDLRDAIEREKIIAAELQHRIKNALTLVTAIANQTLRSLEAEPEKQAFLSRLSALSEAHDLIHTSQWTGANVAEVVQKALSPHQPPGPPRIFTDGPVVTLNAKQALSLALSLHELATNAMKYGALSNAHGTVAVAWSIVDSGGASTFRFAWTERGGPPPTGEPSRKGFGTRLLERVLKNDFQGDIALRYDREGFSLELTTALENIG